MNATTIHPKVQAVGATGAIATLVVFVLGAFGVTIPAAVLAAVLTLVVVAAGYIKRGPEVLAEVNADAAAIEPVAEVVVPVVAAKVQGSGS